MLENIEYTTRKLCIGAHDQNIRMSNQYLAICKFEIYKWTWQTRRKSSCSPAPEMRKVHVGGELPFRVSTPTNRRPGSTKLSLSSPSRPLRRTLASPRYVSAANRFYGPVGCRQYQFCAVSWAWTGWMLFISGG